MRNLLLKLLVKPANQYRAAVVSVHDGDSLTVNVDLGILRLWLHDQPIRLAGCNARELSTPGGPEARDHLAALLPAGTPLVIRTVSADKYGSRWDAAAVYRDTTGTEIDLVTHLITESWAAAWSGAGPKPVPPWPRPAPP